MFEGKKVHLKGAKHRLGTKLLSENIELGISHVVHYAVENQIKVSKK
jgi:hypothetical protein